MITLKIPNTGNMSWNRWSSEIALQEPTVPVQFPENGWQRWGAELLLVTGLQNVTLPQPYDFNDWRIWGERLRSALIDIA